MYFQDQKVEALGKKPRWPELRHNKCVRICFIFSLGIYFRRRDGRQESRVRSLPFKATPRSTFASSSKWKKVHNLLTAPRTTAVLFPVSKQNNNASVFDCADRLCFVCKHLIKRSFFESCI